MKYIRTKDGIYEVIEFHTTTTEHESFISDYFCKGLITILAKEVIDISLSIKELCDCFIFEDVGCEPEILYKDDLPIFPTEESKLYGAIFVRGVHNEPILKPVAKANDKGDLELLWTI